MGVSELTWGTDFELGTFAGAENGYYDSTDHLVAYANGTYVDDYGNITTPITQGGAGIWNNIPIWKNASGSFNVYSDTGERLAPDATAAQVSFSLSSSLGLIAVVVGVIILATVAGMRIVSSGESDVSVSAIVKGSVYISLWAVFSVTSLAMMMQIPLIGGIFYFFLTAIYTMGIINQIGSPGDE